MIRLVLDTNIWISALWGSKSVLPLLEAWADGHFELMSSEFLVDELDQVWRRPRFKDHIDPLDAESIIEQIHYRGNFVQLVTAPPNCRDSKDNPILATAITRRRSTAG